MHIESNLVMNRSMVLTAKANTRTKKDHSRKVALAAAAVLLLFMAVPAVPVVMGGDMAAEAVTPVGSSGRQDVYGNTPDVLAMFLAGTGLIGLGAAVRRAS